MLDWSRSLGRERILRMGNMVRVVRRMCMVRVMSMLSVMVMSTHAGIRMAPRKMLCGMSGSRSKIPESIRMLCSVGGRG